MINLSVLIIVCIGIIGGIKQGLDNINIARHGFCTDQKEYDRSVYIFLDT